MHSLSEAAAGEDRPVRSSLEDSELRYRRLFEAAQDGILILDAATGAITDVNPFLIDLLGYSREELLGKKLWEVGAFRDIQASKDAFQALQEREYIRYLDLPLKAKDGRLVQVEFVSNVYLAGVERVIQCNIRDITQRQEAEDALRRSEALYREQSVRDHLTGLYNRRYMEETLYRELRRALRRQGSVAIVMLDVDDLKNINDTLGHPAGDAALLKLAGLLQENIRDEDIASRYGGDEFILILPDMSKEMAHQRAALLCQAAGDQKLQFEQQKATALRISAGVASFPEDGLTAAAIMQAADAALYRAKHQRRGTAVASE